MNDLRQHYHAVLGLDSTWRVDEVNLKMAEQRVEVRLEHCGGKLVCAECGSACSQADRSPERQWRHLDMMQFETIIIARIPRSNCNKCGVKQIKIPWSEPHMRFTLMFEALAIEVLLACSSVERARHLLGLSWQSAHQIMERAVNRGLAKRSDETVEHVGIDEKNFLKGQSYVSVMTDIDGHRVLEVSEGRTEESADELWKTMSKRQRSQVKAVAMDMWTAYMNSAQANVPEADIVHDKFHIAKHLNEAVDQVRRAENKELRANDDERLTGSRQLWLYNENNLDQDRFNRFQDLKSQNLKTAKAWALKEQFRGFWTFSMPGWGKRFFDKWNGWASRCRLTPIVKAAKRIADHLPNILNYFKHGVTNSTAEGFNSKIQFLKAAARGFKVFKNYRNRILFYCGKLDLFVSAQQCRG